MSLTLHVEKRARTLAHTMTEDSSAGPQPLPLVCLHGWGMNLRVFDLLRDGLAADRDTIALDLTGHGRSAWRVDRAHFDAQVEDILRALPPRCALLGWSFGGKLAIELAVRAPERIAALVLVAVSPKFAQTADWPHGLEPRAMKAFRTVLAQDWQQTLTDFVWLQLRGSRNAEAAQEVLQAALASQGAPHPEALGNGMDLLNNLDLRARALQITQPLLLVSGQNDRVTPPAAARWLAASLPQAEVVEVPRAGHAPFVSHHVEVTAAVRHFLAVHAAGHA